MIGLQSSHSMGKSSIVAIKNNNVIVKGVGSPQNHLCRAWQSYDVSSAPFYEEIGFSMVDRNMVFGLNLGPLSSRFHKR